MGGDYRLRLIVTYRPPYYNEAARTDASTLYRELTKLCDIKWPCFIVGDFNCPHINWQTCSAPNDGIQDSLICFVNDNNFCQLVKEPTRNIHVLDLVLCNEPLLVYDLSVQCPVGNSDHDSVQFNIARTVSEPQMQSCKHAETVYDWQHADFDSMANFLRTVDWHGMVSCNLTADTLWAAFSALLQDAMDRFVPVRKLTAPSRQNKNRQYPTAIRKAISRKRCLWRKHRQDPTNTVVSEAYRAAHRECRKLMNDYEVKAEEKVINANNLGSFYRFTHQ